jgi:uncharacterized membrane protein
MTGNERPFIHAGMVLAGSIIGGMAIVFTVPDEVSSLIESLASSRGVSPTEVIIAAVQQMADHDRGRVERVNASIVRHQAILDRLATA